IGLFVEALGGVAVENRAPEGNVRFGVAVGSQRHVPAGHHELKLSVAGLAENRDALIAAPQLAAGVVLELLAALAVPPRIDETLKNVVNNVLLLDRIETAADARLGDVPVVRHKCPQ